VLQRLDKLTIYPASHHVTPEDIREKALETIETELESRVKAFEQEGKLVEAQRIFQRTKYDFEMIKEIGFCKGIENYSRHFSARLSGEAPPCLLDYFPEDFLIFVDESHQTLPQIHAMFNGDRARKTALVEFGFRLPSAYDNRPLKFEEFYKKISQVVYVSATPAAWEVTEAGGEIISQVIRPTGLLDPEIEIRPATYQVDDALDEIRKEIEKGGRILVTTLTKKLSEDLSKYLEEIGVKAKYLHSDIDTLERMQIIKDLRRGNFDVLVGINLLREGLDIPEVTLVTILDADKEGFLRSETALIQTCGRAARNAQGRVIMYADKITKSIKSTLDTTQARRKIQEEYNQEHGITPKTVKRDIVEDLSETFFGATDEERLGIDPSKLTFILTREDLKKKIKETEDLMKKAAKDLNFEEAAKYRDLLKHYRDLELLEDNPL
jgi:excinuclease ABC subunit B